ncbi:4-hydroxythreonine-4-phosphate dehydrogenase [Arsenicitalea aurantiaca]|uniref:4-hydroxythreonine-4-phosphate dehydrogenase n=1 Tax=Arsenicitalea aurantiaca TaxID=1783274 RepID=A0A433XKD6_9HYPH|nr:4-hydroxythreonine-4-phosphate dehydrogenase PdxA [Arsenicitalea aurantiaca]RUT34552.1 4-hydroxythreonine-4-phosphate dehydrogenase [Arsenicitalea aurantiaca]
MTATTPAGPRPAIALAMGDPAGISPELTAKLLATEAVTDAAALTVFGDRRVLERGAEIGGVTLDIAVVGSVEDAAAAGTGRPVLVDLGNLDPTDVPPATASAIGGAFATDNFRHALRHAAGGKAEAVCFTPFNKQAMRAVNTDYDDESRFVRAELGWSGAAKEFNVLPEVWNARVTSHIPLSQVAAAISREAILAELQFTYDTMRLAGVEAPRIALAALNPHAGDGGNFGREEIEILEPAVADAIAQGLPVDGPWPSDTVFLRARKGQCNAVLTMYHDQGQIAMKMMGFDLGVTLIGGFPFPICTPAHGTAYDIAGQGIADVGASVQALLLASRMALRGRATA